jgi:protein-S-isoprenylcysteine O-methyltransferase Ste14
MSEQRKDNDQTALAIPGGLLFGIGVGFFFFPQGAFGVTSVFAFVGCIIGGLGLGLFTTAYLSSKGK